MSNELSEKGAKSAERQINNNATLYVFEKEGGKKIVFDGLNKFARTIGVHPSNLYRTYKKQNYQCKKWKLVDIIDLLTPDWKVINKKLRFCTIPKRIEEKLNNLENELITLKKHGYRLWNKIKNGIVTAAKNSYLDMKAVAAYIEEKRLEPVTVPVYAQRYSEMSESDLDDLKERNARAYEDSLGFA